MKHHRFNKYFLFTVLTCLTVTLLPACHTQKPLENKTKLTKEEKMVNKLESKEKKKQMAEYKAAVKAHRENQSEATKKMMKADKKQQRKNNRIHRRSLWDRLFNNR